MSEPLYTCPCCSTAGFTAQGLHRHQCQEKENRARLTLVEIAAAKPSEPLKPLAKVSVKKGGAS